MNLKDLEKIIEILKHSDVNEFELEQEGTNIRITRGQQNVAPTVVAAQPSFAAPVNYNIPVQGNSVSPAAPVAAPAADAGLVKVESPIVGTFYRRSSPDSEPYAQVGSRVKKGDTLCIVEAMKLMNEIESPADGVIEQIMIEDGHIVEYGEVIFLIRP